MTLRLASVLLGMLLLLCSAGLAEAGSSYAVGDVFLGINGVGVEEFTPTGTLVQTINGGGGLFTVTGMAFQSNGNLLVTNFGGGNVVQYDNSGNLLNASFVTGISAPESIAIDSTGNVYVSSVGGTGITKYTSAGGAAINTSIAGTRSDWIDLAADQKTMLYTQENTSVFSVNVATNTSNPSFSTLGGNHAALRIIPTGAFAGDVLVSDEQSGNPELLSADGSTIVKTYTGGGLGVDFALNIDANGTAFWTADTDGNVVEFDIASGAILQKWSANATTFGLVVFGQQTASGGGGGGVTPEPGSIFLLVTGLLGAALAKKSVWS